MDLPKILAELRAAGVTRGRYTEDASGGGSLEVEFGAAVKPLGMTDANGAPVNLDEGMTSLHKDPLGLEDEPAVPDPMLTRNFKKAGTDAAS